MRNSLRARLVKEYAKHQLLVVDEAQKQEKETKG